MQGLKHNAVSSGHDSTELPYLDMDDEDEAELLEATLAQPRTAVVQSALGVSSISPPKARPSRNPPPLPAPSMALPDLPARPSSAAQTAVRQHTPTSSVQLDAQQRDGQAASASSSKQTPGRSFCPRCDRRRASTDSLSSVQQLPRLQQDQLRPTWSTAPVSSH